MSKGILGGIFDFNRDGEMSTFESAAEFGFLQSVIDEEERREALEEAGFDPDDYDID